MFFKEWYLIVSIPDLCNLTYFTFILSKTVKHVSFIIWVNNCGLLRYRFHLLLKSSAEKSASMQSYRIFSTRSQLLLNYWGPWWCIPVFQSLYQQESKINVNRCNAIYLQTAGKERKLYERVKNHRLNVVFNRVSEIKFPEGKYGHQLFYLHFVSNLCEYATKNFHFIYLTIQDTREQKYFIVRQYSTIKSGI